MAEPQCEATSQRQSGALPQPVVFKKNVEPLHVGTGTNTNAPPPRLSSRPAHN